jgi:hypothetical protein
LQQEREEYEVIVEAEKLIYKKSRLPVDTFDGSKWIFVLSASRKLYVGKKQKGLFQHSSFLSGGAAIAAGRLVARSGFLEVCIYIYTHVACTYKSSIFLIPCHIQAKMKENKFLHLV